MSSNCVTPHLLAELTEARDYFLGDLSLRTTTTPVEGPDGKRHGGTHFERVEKPSGINSAVHTPLALATKVRTLWHHLLTGGSWIAISRHLDL